MIRVYNRNTMTTPTISATISKDGKITIPKKLRKALKLNNGQPVVLRQMGERLLIEKAGEPSARTKAEALVVQAKANAARKAMTLDPDAVWAQYDVAAAALRKALRVDRASKAKR
jgi:AbrB family looped-hinge helix DNA binding protein